MFCTRSIARALRLVLAGLISITIFSSLASGQLVYDHFDSADVDDRLWWDNPNFDIWQEASLLHFASGIGNGTSLAAQQTFRGDLEVEMDFQGLVSAGQGHFTVQIQEPMQSSFYYLMREEGFSWSRISLHAIGAGSTGTPFEFRTSVDQGRLKLVRSGSSVHGYYDVGSGWVLLGSFSNAYTGDLGVQIGMSGFTHVATDAVRYVGTPVLPSPDVQVNGTDGPVIVAAGALADVTIALNTHLATGQQGLLYVKAFLPNFQPFWYRSPGWKRSWSPLPFYSGPLANITPMSILSSTAIPPGNYEIQFAAVTLPFTGEMQMDSVLVTVQ